MLWAIEADKSYSVRREGCCSLALTESDDGQGIYPSGWPASLFDMACMGQLEAQTIRGAWPRC